MNFTPSPKQEKIKKAMSTSPPRSVSDGKTMGTSSNIDRLMMSMCTQRGGASSSTRLHSQIKSSSLGLTPVLDSACVVIDILANSATVFEELRRDKTKGIDRVEEKAQQGHEKLRDELADAKPQAKSDQVQLVQNTDQCLAESLAVAYKKTEKGNSRMTRQIDRLLNDYKSSYAQTMTNLENRLVVKADLMMRKLDEFVRSNRESRSGPVENLRQPTDRFRAPRDTKAPPNSRTSFESNPRERSRAAPSSAGWADPISPKVKAPWESPFPTCLTSDRLDHCLT